MAHVVDDLVPATPVPRALRLLIGLAIPMIAALTVVGTYLGQEIIIFAGWVGLLMAAALFVRPVYGLAAMTAVYLLTAYPTLLQSLGFFTINNLLGACFAVLVAAHVLETRDLFFLKLPQVLLLVVIGLLLLAATTHSDVIFPLLQESRGKGKIIDRTSDMAHDYITRLVFLIFLCMFVRNGRDIRIMFLTLMLGLFLAVPSALWNWHTGDLNRGFRAVSSLTAGSNPNRLAMICLIEMACWWFWALTRPGLVRRLLAGGAIGASFLVLLVTGSRSGLLGAGVLAVLLQTGPRQFRASWVYITACALLGVIAIVTIVPEEDWERMTNLVPDDKTVGATSTMKREDTIEVGLNMIKDQPALGVGLGNFREVSRQFYFNKYFRPPHNSFLWAAAEGGLFTLLAYLALFAVTAKDLLIVTRFAGRDPTVAPYAIGMRTIFLLYMFFSLLADLWLNPITYVMMGIIISMRRYLEALPAVATTAVRPPGTRRAVAVLR